MLSDHIATNTSLEELSLKANDIGDDGLTALCTALQQRPTSLKVLDVGNNALTEEGAKALAGWLPSASQLQDLNVYMNDMGDAGADMVCFLGGECLLEEVLWVLFRGVGVGGCV